MARKEGEDSMRRITVACLALALLALGAQVAAAAPADTPPVPTDRPTRMTQTGGFAGASETTVSGMVVDSNGKPLKDVSVKLYVGGLLLSEAVTSLDGGFEMYELIDYARDVTIDLWFVPTDPNLVMENVILKESSAAIENNLYSDCITRVRLDPITDVVVRLGDLETRIERMKASGCAH